METPEDIKAGNELIQLFIDHKYYHNYFDNWHWLMQVVEKINKIGYPQNDYSFIIYPSAAEVEKNGPFGDTISCNKMTDDTTLIELVWTTVVEFIEYYNNLQDEQAGNIQID